MLCLRLFLRFSLVSREMQFRWKKTPLLAYFSLEVDGVIGYYGNNENIEK